MNALTLGFRNAFRNVTRAISIMVILGLSIGLSLVMLIAHQAVTKKISDAKSSIGNTITIAPAGFSAFSQVNNALTTSQLNSIGSMPHVTGVVENLTDRLTTVGSAQPAFGGFGGQSTKSNSNNQTSLKSPVTLSSNAGRFRTFISGGGSLPVDFSLPITITGTTSPTQLDGNTLNITKGSAISGSNDTNNAMVSGSMAKKNGLKVGSTFTAYGKKLTVAAIFSTSTQTARDTVIVSLPAEQRLSGKTGDVTSAVVTVDSADNLTSTSTAIKNSLGSSADITSSADQVNQAIQPLNSVKNIALYSLIGAVIAGCLIILLTMIMIVRERRREIGILKAIGANNSHVILQFMSEAVTLTIAGALIGIVIGVIGGNPVTNTLVTSSSNSSTTTTAAASGPRRFGQGAGGPGDGQGFVARSTTGRNFFGRNANSLTNSVRNVHANVGWSILAYGLGAAVLIAVIGSSLAGWMIARVRPSEVMRAE